MPDENPDLPLPAPPASPSFNLGPMHENPDLPMDENLDLLAPPLEESPDAMLGNGPPMEETPLQGG